MTLSDHERRTFQEIERRFEAEATADRTRRPTRLVLVLTGCWMVGVLLLMALLTGTWIMVAASAAIGMALVWRPLVRGCGRGR
jgi:fatty acid desaturase